MTTNSSCNLKLPPQYFLHFFLSPNGNEYHTERLMKISFALFFLEFSYKIVYTSFRYFSDFVLFSDCIFIKRITAKTTRVV